MLDLEVFRSHPPGTRSEEPMPSPSVSSGATAEFYRSRQSLDSRARLLVTWDSFEPAAPRRPHVGRPFRACTSRGDGRLTAPRSTIVGEPAMSDPITRIGALDAAPTGSVGGATSEEAAPAADQEAEVTRQTRRLAKDRPEQMPPTEAGETSLPSPLGPRWQAIVTDRESARRRACQRQHTSQ